jgi:hypothetical protein
LPLSQHLFLNARAPRDGVDTLGLSDWTEAIDAHFCEHRIEGVCSVYNAINHREKSIFKHCGSLTLEDVEKWGNDLIINRIQLCDPKNPGKFVHYPSYQFDEANLCYMAKIIKALVDGALWSWITDDLGPDPPGNLDFLAIAQMIQQTTASASCHLIKQLETMTFLDEPVENVLHFSKRISDIA